MTVDILSRVAVTTPAAGQATLFLDSGNANALTAKYADCTFKVLSAEPYQLKESQSLLDAQNDFLDVLRCGIKQGTVTMTELQTLLESFQLYYSSNIDVNGNLNQSISYSAPAVGSGDFSVLLFSPTNFGKEVNIAITSLSASTPDVNVSVDRLGMLGDVSVSFTSPIPGLTMEVHSYVTNSLGVPTQSALNIISDGVSAASGEFIYDGTATTAGTYAGVITLSNGSINKFISVEVVVS